MQNAAAVDKAEKARRDSQDQPLAEVPGSARRPDDDPGPAGTTCFCSHFERKRQQGPSQRHLASVTVASGPAPATWRCPGSAPGRWRKPCRVGLVQLLGLRQRVAELLLLGSGGDSELGLPLVVARGDGAALGERVEHSRSEGVLARVLPSMSRTIVPRHAATNRREPSAPQCAVAQR